MNEEGEMVENFPTVGKEAWKVTIFLGLSWWGGRQTFVCVSSYIVE